MFATARNGPARVWVVDSPLGSNIGWRQDAPLGGGQTRPSPENHVRRGGQDNADPRGLQPSTQLAAARMHAAPIHRWQLERTSGALTREMTLRKTVAMQPMRADKPENPTQGEAHREARALLRRQRRALVTPQPKHGPEVP